MDRDSQGIKPAMEVMVYTEDLWMSYPCPNYIVKKLKSDHMNDSLPFDLFLIFIQYTVLLHVYVYTVYQNKRIT